MRAGSRTVVAPGTFEGRLPVGSEPDLRDSLVLIGHTHQHGDGDSQNDEQRHCEDSVQ